MFNLSTVRDVANFATNSENLKVQEAKQKSLFKTFCANANLDDDRVKAECKGLLNIPTPEDLLRGVIFSVNDPTQVEKVKEEFNSGATSVHTRGLNPKYGSEDIVLVYGPSGSGKSFYMIKHVPNVDRAVGCTIHFSAQKIEDNIATYFAESSLLPGLQEHLANEIGPGKGVVPSDLVDLDLNLCLVIDDAGGYNVADYLGKIGNLRSIYMIIMEIARRPRLVVGRTGFDPVAKEIGTEPQAAKCHMLPWTAEHFKSFAGEDHKEAVDFVLSSPILKGLISNARAASFVLDEVKKLPDLSTATDWYIEEVSRVVDSVARSFIEQNSLSKLNERERRQVAKLVFEELDRSARTEKAEFPVLPTTIGKSDPYSASIRNCAYALLDTNVEKLYPAATYVMREVEVASSVSPAVAAVLFFIFGFRGRLYADWKGVEVIAGLYCLRQLVMRDDVDLDLVNLQKLRMAFPAPNARKKFEVPIFPGYGVRNTAWINGPMAPFADAVAPFLLVQARHTPSVSRLVEINLQKELGKMGVSKDANGFQHAFISALYWTWESGTVLEEAQNSKGDDLEGRDVSTTAFDNPLCRPENLFLAEGLVGGETPHLAFQHLNETSFSSKSSEVFSMMKDAFPREVQVVFLTNAHQVTLMNNNRSEKVEVGLHDVVRSTGLLSNEKSEQVSKLCPDLKGNVRLVFRFV